MSRVFVIAQGGGPTAVINQTLVGAVLEARKRHPGAKVLGARHGVRGIAGGDYVDLSALSEADLRRFADTQKRYRQFDQSHFAPRRRRDHVRVAANDMQPDPFRWIGMRLVTRVEKRPTIKRLEAHRLHQEIRALAELVVAFSPLLRADFPGAAKHLPCDKHWHDRCVERFEPYWPRNEIVLMAAVRRAVKIGVVFVELRRRLRLSREGGRGAARRQLTGKIM